MLHPGCTRFLFKVSRFEFEVFKNLERRSANPLLSGTGDCFSNPKNRNLTCFAIDGSSCAQGQDADEDCQQNHAGEEQPGGDFHPVVFVGDDLLEGFLHFTEVPGVVVKLAGLPAGNSAAKSCCPVRSGSCKRISSPD